MKGEKISILDTCAILAKKPFDMAMREAKRNGYILIVPQKVREELYGLRKNKKIRPAVDHALELVAQNKWRSLPYEGKFPTADDEILSFCRSHSDAPLQVYTRDMGLRQKLRKECPHVVCPMYELQSCKQPEGTRCKSEEERNESQSYGREYDYDDYDDYVAEYEAELAMMEYWDRYRNPFDSDRSWKIDRQVWDYLNND